MSRAVSPSAKRPYGLARVCRVWCVARSSVYYKRLTREAVPTRKRGPQGPCSDTELADHIRATLKESPWVGEGYRKVWAKLRNRGIRVSARRVLRVMREKALQTPVGQRHRHGPKAHDRSIVPGAPNVLWGSDATATLTTEGMATIFLVIDHATAECLGIHAARRGTRWEAIATLQQAVGERFGRYEKDLFEGVGLKLRHDHGSQFVSHAFQDELVLVGIESSPAFVREPEGNGCAERFIRTLKEQLLWLRRFQTIEGLRQALLEFKERYNREWMIQRHGWRSPSEQRKCLLAEQEAA